MNFKIYTWPLRDRWHYDVLCRVDKEQADIHSDTDHISYPTKHDAEVAANSWFECAEWDTDLRLHFAGSWHWELRVPDLAGSVVSALDYATQEEARRAGLQWASRLWLRKRSETVV